MGDTHITPHAHLFTEHTRDRTLENGIKVHALTQPAHTKKFQLMPTAAAAVQLLQEAVLDKMESPSFNQEHTALKPSPKPPIKAATA